MRRTILTLAAALTAAPLFASAAQAAAPSVIACGWEGRVIVESRPTNCRLSWPNLPNASSVTMQALRWSGWGGPVATATGRERYRTYEPWHPLTARASRRVRCEDKLYYTRVRVTFSSGRSHTWRTPTCREF